MLSSYNVKLALLAVALRTAAAADYSFGNMFYAGPVSGSDNYISKATWSLVAPDPPSDAAAGDSNDPPFMSIWVGVSDTMDVSSATLVQPLLNWSTDQESQGCAASATEWCVAASTYQPAGSSAQKGQPYVVVKKGSTLKFEISTTADQSSTQKVWQDGALVSQQTDTMRGPPLHLYSSNECYTGTCGSLAGYSWDDVTVTLAQADAAFGDTVTLTGARGSLSSSDGGTTWTGSFDIDPDSFNGGGE